MAPYSLSAFSSSYLFVNVSSCGQRLRSAQLAADPDPEPCSVFEKRVVLWGGADHGFTVLLSVLTWFLLSVGFTSVLT